MPRSDDLQNRPCRRQSSTTLSITRQHDELFDDALPVGCEVVATS